MYVKFKQTPAKFSAFHTASSLADGCRLLTGSSAAACCSDNPKSWDESLTDFAAMAVRDEQMHFSNSLCNCYKQALQLTYHSEVWQPLELRSSAFCTSYWQCNCMCGLHGATQVAVLHRAAFLRLLASSVVRRHGTRTTGCS